MSSTDLILATCGEHGEAWIEATRRSRHLRLVAAIDLEAGGIENLSHLLDNAPQIAVAAWGSGPIMATRLAERLRDHRGLALLHAPLSHVPPGRNVQLSHGWVLHQGIDAIQHLLVQARVKTVKLEISGVPEGPTDDLQAALYHCGTLLSCFGGPFRVQAAKVTSESQLDITVLRHGVPWELEINTRGHGLQMEVISTAGVVRWEVTEFTESVHMPYREARVQRVLPWAERTLGLLTRPNRYVDLPGAASALQFVQRVEEELTHRCPPAPQKFRATHDALAYELEELGLAGDLHDAPKQALTAPPKLPWPGPVLAYQYGFTPAIVVDLPSHLQAIYQDALPGVVRLRDLPPIRTQVFGSTRARLEPRIRLIAARQSALANHIVDLLQVEEDEIDRRALGEALNYPACCIDAWERQCSFNDTSFRRYATAARTTFGAEWPALLNDTSLSLLPHSMCSYRCPSSIGLIEQVLQALSDRHPALVAEIEQYLRGPVLYFNQNNQLHFRGHAMGDSIYYRSVSLPWGDNPAFRRFATIVAAGDQLQLNDLSLQVFKGPQPILTLLRTDPALGEIFPFADVRDTMPNPIQLGENDLDDGEFANGNLHRSSIRNPASSND